MDTDLDLTLVQLRKLREGRGLSANRLAASPAVLASLAVTDPIEAYDALVQLLDRMGDGNRVRALKVDFGVQLDDLLGRMPTPREQDLLGERRCGFGEVVQRDAKTLARWSNQALAELSSQLITDYFDGHVIVAAGVSNRRVAGIEVLRYDKTDEQLSEGRNQGYTNPEPGPSLPVVFWGVPADWRPQSIRFVISFLDEQPERAWALAVDNDIGISFGHQRFPLEVSDGTVRCRIDDPRQDQLYGVWWEW